MSIFTKTPEQKQAREDKLVGRLRRGQFREIRTTGGLLFKLVVTKEGLVVDSSDPRNQGPLAGARASVATEGEIRERFTATRILFLGIFALAFKKKTSDKDVFFVIEGDGYNIIAGPLKANEMEARRYAQKFNHVAADMAEYGLPV